jgi:toxin ParE1/3/4
MGRYVLGERAQTDTLDIYDYIRQRSSSAAKLVRSELRSAMKKLADFPGMGHRRDDVDDQTLRFWSVYSYLIVYRADTKPLQIVRVIHGARDVPRVLGRR